MQKYKKFKLFSKINKLNRFLSPKHYALNAAVQGLIFSKDKQDLQIKHLLFFILA